MTVKAIPNGYHSITPYLITHDAPAAIDFYKKAFGATELMRLPGPGGKVMHAEIKVGDSPISSMVIARGRSKIRSATCGRSHPIPKMSRRKR